MLSYKFENPNSKIGDQQIHDWSSTFVVFRRLFVFLAPFSAASTRSVRLNPHSPINMQRLQRCLDIFLHWSTVQCIGKVFFIKLFLSPKVTGDGRLFVLGNTKPPLFSFCCCFALHYLSKYLFARFFLLLCFLWEM